MSLHNTFHLHKYCLAYWVANHSIVNYSGSFLWCEIYLEPVLEHISYSLSCICIYVKWLIQNFLERGDSVTMRKKIWRPWQRPFLHFFEINSLPYLSMAWPKDGTSLWPVCITSQGLGHTRFVSINLDLISSLILVIILQAVVWWLCRAS